jgi:anti-anti-sigma factor
LSVDYQRLARESSAFYNTWFLDKESGGIYFNVLANGLPYLLGAERGKGSHSMSSYHSSELAYLAAVYTNLMITKQPMDFYFKPKTTGFEGNILRVQPDILPPGSIRIDSVWINDQSYFDFDSTNLTVQLPETSPTQVGDLRVRVRVVPVQVVFDAVLLEIKNGKAKIALSGVLDADSVQCLRESVEKVMVQPVHELVLELQNLSCINSAGVRALILAKQKLGSSVDIYVTGSNQHVRKFLVDSEFCQEVTMIDQEKALELVNV